MTDRLSIADLTHEWVEDRIIEYASLFLFRLLLLQAYEACKFSIRAFHLVICFKINVSFIIIDVLYFSFANTMLDL